MTAPKPAIDTINPSKSKTWVGLVGSALTALVPYILSVSEALPDPWPVIIGGAIALLTALGVYKAPYKPEGTSVVSNAELREIATPLPPEEGGYQSPWPRP